MINYKFIQELEGYSLTGYVPEPDGGSIESGVTIASGFDIGQRRYNDIIGLNDNIISKLEPYLIITGYDAKLYLESNPLSISHEEAQEINLFAHQDAEVKLISDWEEWSMNDWDELTDKQQTVVASVAFQYGDLPSRTPNFWRQVTSADWGSAVSNLRNFGDAYSTRRNREADYLVGV